MKKIISLLLALALVFTMSSVVSFASVGDTLLNLQTFDHQEEGYIYPDRAPVDSKGWRSQTGKYNDQYPTAVEIVSDNGNKVAKIAHKNHIAEFINDYVTKVDAKTITTTYRVKFADKASNRNLILRGTKEKIVTTFKNDGTVNVGNAYLKNELGENYVYDVDVWYNVKVVYDMANGLVNTTLDDGTSVYSVTGSISADNTKVYRIDFFNQSASGDGSVMYVDDIKVEEGGSIKSVDLTFNQYTSSDNTTDMGVSVTSGITPVYSYIDRGNGDMAFKVDLPGNTGYWQATRHHSSEAFSSGVVLAETDIYFPDYNMNRTLCIRTSLGQTPVIKFISGGAIQIGNTTAYLASLYKYEFGENAPWYHVKAYVDIASGKVRAEIDNGTLTKVFYGNLKSGVTKAWGIEYLIQNNGATSATVSSYFDNLSLSSYINEDPDFFTPDYTYTFDNVTKLAPNTEAYYQNTNEGWFVQNVRHADYEEDVASGTGVEIDGRKALKLWSNGKTPFETINWIASYDAVRFNFDARVDQAGHIRFCVRGYDANNKFNNNAQCLIKVLGNKVSLADGSELGEIALGKWYRYSFVIDAAAGTYTAKLIDLENNTSSVSEAVAVPGDVEDTTKAQSPRKITAFEVFFPTSANTAYIDNVCFSADTTFELVSSTPNASTVDAAIGAEIATTDMIDPSATTYTLNGAENGAWLDANGFNKVEFGYLEPGTEYTLNYTVANLYGDVLNGTITFTTDSLGYGLADLGLSKDTAAPGEILANISGRLPRGEEAQLMVAIYENGDALKLAGVQMLPITAVKEAKTYSIGIDVPDDGKEYKVKAFLWDGITPLLVSEGI